MAELDAKVEAGQAVYTKRVLNVYDWVVLRISNQFIWRCPSRHLRAMYDRHVSANHLDVGVGTGYFLDHCRFPKPDPRLALMDLNGESLAAAAHRVARYNPDTFKVNVLEPIEIEIPAFDSIGMNYLLHCLPGTIQSKAAVFQHLKPYLSQGGVMFGATLLQDGVERSAAARSLMALYNRKGIFSNTEDDLVGLNQMLAETFTDSGVQVIGCAALFWGRVQGS